MEKAIALFSKTPQPGQTKSRLWSALSPEVSALFHRGCLKDLAEVAKRDGTAAYLYWTGEQAGGFLAPFAGTIPPAFAELAQLSMEHFSFRRQQGQDLGERMENAFRELLVNHQRVIIIGSDQPELTGQDLDQAFDLLLDYDLVLGPTVDGGYYLIGLKELYPELFKDVAWGTSQVYRQTRNKANQKRLSIATLPIKQDIDTYEDLVSFHDRQELNPNSRLISYRLAHHYIQIKEDNYYETKD